MSRSQKIFFLYSSNPSNLFYWTKTDFFFWLYAQISGLPKHFRADFENFVFFHIFSNLSVHSISDNILKVCCLSKRLSHQLIKSNKHFRGFYLKRLTVEWYFLYMYVISSNELLVKKFSEFLMYLDCLSQNVSI